MEHLKKAIRDRFHLSIHEAYEYLIIVLVCWLASPSNFSISIGCAISFLGAFLRIWTSGYPREPGNFAVYGPYRFMRHPRLVGSFLMLFGLGIASRSPFAIVTMMLGTIVIFRSTFREEDHLVAQMAGIRFRDYAIHVPAFIPTLVPYPRTEGYGKHFSWGYAMVRSHRRQLDSLLALVLGYGLLLGIREPEFGGNLQRGLALGVTLILLGKSMKRKH